jgi:hypothetical protein
MWNGSPAHAMSQSSPLHGGPPAPLIEAARLRSRTKIRISPRSMPSPRVTRYKSGTDCATHHWPTSPNIPQVTHRPDHEGLSRRSPSRATSPNAEPPNQNMPSPGGQVSGMTGHQRERDWAGVGRVGDPADLPRGATTRRPGGRATRGSPPVTSSAAPVPPRGWATPGRRDAPRLPARKITCGQAAEGHHGPQRAATRTGTDTGRPYDHHSQSAAMGDLTEIPVRDDKRGSGAARP